MRQRAPLQVRGWLPQPGRSEQGVRLQSFCGKLADFIDVNHYL